MRSASSIRDLYDTLKNRTTDFEAHEENPVSHKCILLLMFETKLFPQLLEKWELELADTPDVDIDFYLFIIERLCPKKQERESFTQTLTQIIVVPVMVETKARSQLSPYKLP